MFSCHFGVGTVGCHPLTLRTLIARYAGFAIIATIANLAIQRLVLSQGDSTELFALALVAGTLVGLVIKYLLDKRWIFFDFDTGLHAHGRKFMLYAVMGVFTTAIFWCVETAFWLVWRTDHMREVGALIGLGIGYVVKYKLDRRYVFTDRRMEAVS